MGAADEEANLNTAVDDDASGTRKRGSDIVGVCEQYLRQLRSSIATCQTEYEKVDFASR